MTTETTGISTPIPDHAVSTEERENDYFERMIRHIKQCGIGFIDGEMYPYPILLRELEEKIVVDSSWGAFEEAGHEAKAEALDRVKRGMERQLNRIEPEQPEFKTPAAWPADLPPEVLPALFTTPSEIYRLVKHAEDEARAHSFDTSSKKGRDAIKALAHKVARSKTALDAAGKSLNEGLRAQINAVDAVRREARERLDALKVEVRQPLTDWEAAEEERVALHQEWIEFLKSRGDTVGSLEALRDALATVRDMIVDEKLEEFENEAHRAKAAAITALEQKIAAAEKAEADRLELERLRAEAAARAEEDRKRQEAEAAEARRIAAEKAEAARQAEIEREKQEAAARAVREAEERIKRQAAEDAHRAKVEQDRRDQEARDREATLKRQAEEAERRAAAAAQAERDRIAAEQKAAAEAQAKREANARVRNRVLKEIALSITKLNLPTVDGEPLSAKGAMAIAEALADGKIPHCKVTF